MLLPFKNHRNSNRGLAQVFIAVDTTTKPAAPRFVVFEAWAFLLPWLGDFLGCTRSLLPLFNGRMGVSNFSTDLFLPMFT